MTKIKNEYETIYVLYEPSKHIQWRKNENKIWEKIEKELEGKSMRYGTIKIQKEKETEKTPTPEILEKHIRNHNLDKTVINILGGVAQKDTWYIERKPMYRDMKRIVSEILNYENPIHQEEYHVGAIIIVKEEEATERHP